MPRYYPDDDEMFEEKRPPMKNAKQRHEDCFPRCDERHFFKEPDFCERPKKRRCDDERWDFPEKSCWPPCPDWFCPPPWFWCKPECEEKKECERKKKDECEKRRECECKDECENRNECEKKKEGKGELEAYAYVYSLTATPVTVLTNADVVFTNNGPLECVTHTPNTSQVFIRKSGVYNVFYAVHATAGAGATISLAVNGVVDPATTISLAITPGEAVGKALVNLRSGEFLTLRNSSATPIILATAPALGAQLTLERIDELECNRFM